MTEITTIAWFGRWGSSVFSENTAIFSLFFLPLTQLFCKLKKKKKLMSFFFFFFDLRPNFLEKNL